MDHDATSEAIALADRTCRLTSKLLGKQRTDLSDRRRVMMLAHVLRMLRFTQAAVTLTQAGSFEPACATTRTVLEMGWVLLAIQADPAKFDEWREQANGEAIKSIRRLKLLGEHERLPTLADANIDAAIASMPPGKNFNLKEWAVASGAAGSYPTLYQTLSACAHGEMGSTLAYTRWDESTGDFTSVEDPDLAELPADSLCVCVAVLLDGVRYVAGDTLAGDDLRAVESLETLRRALTQRLDRIRMKLVQAEHQPHDEKVDPGGS
jgi:hypothetical protein